MKSKLYEFAPNTEKILVVGDLHGDLGAFNAAVKYWQSQINAWIVFLGDYADRGTNGVEVIESLIKISAGERVILLKGNHEDYSDSGEPQFNPCTLISEVEQKGGNWREYFDRTLKSFFTQLYLAALLPKRILFLHGGINNKIENNEDLRYPSKTVDEDILWSDPVDQNGESSNPRGKGVEFGPDISRQVLSRLDVFQIIRSHEPRKALSSPHLTHEGRVITISSTAVYGGQPYLLEIENRQKDYSYRTITLKST